VTNKISLDNYRPSAVLLATSAKIN